MNRHVDALLRDPGLMEARMLERQRRLAAAERRLDRIAKERDRWHQARPERERNAARLRARFGR